MYPLNHTQSFDLTVAPKAAFLLASSFFDQKKKFTENKKQTMSSLQAGWFILRPFVFYIFYSVLYDFCQKAITNRFFLSFCVFF